MQKKSILLVKIFFILFLFVHSSGYAGAWTQQKNKYFMRIYSSYLFATKEFNYRGDQLDLYEEHLGYSNAYFRNISFIVYTEYGLSDAFTLMAELPFTSMTTKRTISSYYGRDEIATTSGFTDLRLSGKLGVFDGPLVISVQGGIMIPMGYSTEPSNNGPRLGSGEVNYEGHLLLGSSFYPLPMYFSGSVGFRHRNGLLHDEIIFTGELGLTFGRFFFKTYLEVLRNVVTPPDIYGQRIETPLPGGGGVVPDVLIGDQHLTKIIPSLSYQVSKILALQVEVIQPMAGTNTLNGITYSFGIVLTN